jgi:hypothetical protein
MKKLILAITVAAFTVGAYANDGATKDKAACGEKAACGDKDKAAACCPAAKGQCPASGATAKKDAGKKVVQSPKGQQASKS